MDNRTLSAKRKHSSEDDDVSVESSGNGSDQSSDRDTENNEVSNLAHVKPKVGMRLEIRDSDYIWSAAHLIGVENDNTVTVRCDGWGKDWDEEVPWPSERLASLYTYTKRVKCFVNILPKIKHKKKGTPKAFLQSGDTKKPLKRVFSNLWPCTVQFRMPHPFRDGGCTNDQEQCDRAEELLKLEVNVFVQPYGVSLLPKHVADSLDDDGGRWLHNQRLRLWRDDPSDLGILPKHFETAFQEAKNDSQVPGVLHPKALVEGSLLDDMYRVRSIDGENSGGALLQAPSAIRSGPQPKPPKVDKGNQAENDGKEDEEEKAPEFHPTKYEPPPDFPPPVRMTEPLFPGVVRCQKSNQWIATVSMGGNDVFLGSFPTQTQAWNATKMNCNAKTDQAVGKQADLEAARLADLRAVPMEAIIDSAEKHSSHGFSLHEWTLQQIRHRAYQQEFEENKREVPARTNHDAILEASVDGSKSKRKQCRPRKVDLRKRRYV